MCLPAPLLRVGYVWLFLSFSFSFFFAFLSLFLPPPPPSSSSSCRGQQWTKMERKIFGRTTKKLSGQTGKSSSKKGKRFISFFFFTGFYRVFLCPHSKNGSYDLSVPTSKRKTYEMIRLRCFTGFYRVFLCPHCEHWSIFGFELGLIQCYSFVFSSSR